jgi:hypothetical protein
MTTDFLVCGEDDAAVKLATVDDIAKCLKIRLGDMNEPTDYEFVSSADLVQQVVEAKVSGLVIDIKCACSSHVSSILYLPLSCLQLDSSKWHFT